MKKIYSLLIVPALLLGACGSEEAETEAVEETKPAAEEKAIDRDGSGKNETAEAAAKEKLSTEWEAKVKEIASSSQSETEKFDQVMMLGKEFTFPEEEMKEFEGALINEFTSGNYLADIENHEYMLKNIFKARAIDLYYEDEQGVAIDSFAFDFLQNTKYTYRKVDAVDSDSVIANEQQMNETLNEIN